MAMGMKKGGGTGPAAWVSRGWGESKALSEAGFNLSKWSGMLC